MILSQYISGCLSSLLAIMCSTYRLLLEQCVSITAPPPRSLPSAALQPLLPHILSRSRHTFIHPDPKVAQYYSLLS